MQVNKQMDETNISNQILADKLARRILAAHPERDAINSFWYLAELQCLKVILITYIERETTINLEEVCAYLETATPESLIGDFAESTDKSVRKTGERLERIGPKERGSMLASVHLQCVTSLHQKKSARTPRV